MASLMFNIQSFIGIKMQSHILSARCDQNQKHDSKYRLLYFSLDISHATFLSFFDQNSKMPLLTQLLKIELQDLTYTLSACTIKLYNIILFLFYIFGIWRFPRSNSFTSCNMPQIVPKICLHLLLDDLGDNPG